MGDKDGERSTNRKACQRGITRSTMEDFRDLNLCAQLPQSVWEVSVRVGKLQVELKAEKHAKLSDIGVLGLIQVGEPMDKVNTEELEYIFDTIAQLHIR